ncbi:MAG: hypothetical protein IKO47_05745 [Ruminococcus sp.]|nr:hypothetical protein [Ruminococcus sp.]
MKNPQPSLLICGSSILTRLTARITEAEGIQTTLFSGRLSELRNTVKELRPDTVIIEARAGAPGNGDAPLITELCDLFNYTTFLVTVCSDSGSYLRSFGFRRNLRLVMLPVSPDDLAAAAIAHAWRNKGGFIQPDIMAHLRLSGFYKKVFGFDVLCVAAEMCIREPLRLTDLMNSVYGDVGRRTITEPSAVERQIRFLSTSLYKIGLTKALVRGESSSKLTNREVISAVCDSFIAYMRKQGVTEDIIRMLP